MEARIVFAFLIAFVLCQVIIAGVLTEMRETADGIITDTRDSIKYGLTKMRETADETITNMLDSIKSGFNDLVKGVQSTKLVRSATQALSGFAQSVEAQGTELSEKINLL